MLKFQIDRLTPATTERWRDYYSSEKTTHQTLLEAKAYLTCLHKLFDTPRIPRGKDTTCPSLKDLDMRKRRDYVRATRMEIRRLFAVTPGDTSNVTRFFRKYAPEDWQDPVRMAVILPFDSESPPTYLVYCADEERRIVLSMMVIATESREFQFHQYIFTSLTYLIHRTNNRLPSHGPLSLQLHAYAGKMVGARTIVSFPKESMKRTMIAAGARTPGSDAPEIERFNRVHHDFIWRYCVGPADICLTNDHAFQAMCPTNVGASSLLKREST
jgi:hypothetical protein